MRKQARRSSQIATIGQAGAESPSAKPKRSEQQAARKGEQASAVWQRTGTGGRRLRACRESLLRASVAPGGVGAARLGAEAPGRRARRRYGYRSRSRDRDREQVARAPPHVSERSNWKQKHQCSACGHFTRRLRLRAACLVATCVTASTARGAGAKERKMLTILGMRLDAEKIDETRRERSGEEG